MGRGCLNRMREGGWEVIHGKPFKMCHNQDSICPPKGRGDFVFTLFDEATEMKVTIQLGIHSREEGISLTHTNAMNNYEISSAKTYITFFSEIRSKTLFFFSTPTYTVKSPFHPVDINILYMQMLL